MERQVRLPVYSISMAAVKVSLWQENILSL